MLNAKTSSAQSPTAAPLTFRVRDPRTGDERQLAADTLIFHVPEDLGDGEPVQVRLDADPAYPGGDLCYMTGKSKQRSQLQRAAYRLGDESVAPRGLWLVPESTPGRERFYYVAMVKPDQLGAAGHEVYTASHRYSAVVRGNSLTLTVVRFEDGRAVDPVTFTGGARVIKDSLALDIGEQAAAVPDVVMAQLHGGLTQKLGLERTAEPEPGKVRAERGYAWLCRSENPEHEAPPALRDSLDAALCPHNAPRGWLVLTAEPQAPELPPGWTASPWNPIGGPNYSAGLVIWCDGDRSVFAGRQLSRTETGHARWLYSVVS